MAISNILKDIRVERNLIQEDLAEATGSCSRTIGRIERGERNPSLEMAIRLAHYLNMSVEEIFKLDDDTSCQEKTVSAKYSCGFPDPQVLPIIVVDRYLDYFTTIMEDRLWQVLAEPVSRWRNRSGLSMNAARVA